MIIDGVPDAFAQLLDKLVENALDFAPPGTPIRVALDAKDRGARLAVENDGPPRSRGDAAAGFFDSAA